MTPTLIITRPDPQGAAFAAAVAAQWGSPVPTIISPLMRITPLDVDFDANQAAKLIFTSANGVAQAARLGISLGKVAWCVGDATAQAAQGAGFVPRTGPGDAEQLCSLILQEGAKAPLAHIRGRHARGDIAARLNANGLRCFDVISYDQIALPPTQQVIDAFKGTKPLILPLFSPRTATILAKVGHFTAPLHMVAISAAVAAEVADLGADTVTVAARPNSDAMIAATFERLRVLTCR